VAHNDRFERFTFKPPALPEVTDYKGLRRMAEGKSKKGVLLLPIKGTTALPGRF